MDPSIIDGERARPGEIPYQAALFRLQGNRYSLPCGASLIRSTWALSAAHCWYGDDARWEIRMGGTNFNQLSYRQIATLRIDHPQYDAEFNENDVAIFKLPVAARGQGIAVIPLADSRWSQLNGMRLQVSGYGRTMTGGPSSENLMKVNLQAVDSSVCSNYYRSRNMESILCARWVDRRGQSTCQGDSGGPVTGLDRNNRRVQVGVVSYGASTCHEGQPTGHARVSHLRPWIDNTIAQNS